MKELDFLFRVCAKWEWHKLVKFTEGVYLRKPTETERAKFHHNSSAQNYSLKTLLLAILIFIFISWSPMLTSAAMKRIKRGHMKFLKRDIFYLSVLTLVKPNGCSVSIPLLRTQLYLKNTIHGIKLNHSIPCSLNFPQHLSLRLVQKLDLPCVSIFYNCFVKLVTLAYTHT